MNLFKSVLFLLFISFLGQSCKDKNDNPDTTPSFDQSELLKNWGERTILPSYELYESSVNKLNSSIQSLGENPTSAELNQVKTNLTEAYTHWQGVSLFEIGPAMDVLLRANTNTYPADTTGIESKISSASYDLSTASDLKKKGLPALDYLFFGSKNLSGKNRVNYAKAVAADLQKLSSEVVKAWKSSGGNYLSTYTSSTGSDVGSSIGMTINAINQHLERYLREGKIGIPNGERSFSGTPLPQNVEATYEGSNSLKYALENLKAIERIYLGKSLDGTDGVGLEENLNALGATYNSGSLDEAVKNQIEACYTAFNKVSLPLNQAVVSQNERVSELYTELQKLVVLFKADIPSALGVLITYQDNDGD